VDAAGHLLVVSANGAAFPGDAYDHTSSVLELDANARLLDSFAPSDWAANNQGDVGLGSQGVALIGTRWAVLGGKSGPVYVLKQGHLGGIGGQVGVLYALDPATGKSLGQVDVGVANRFAAPALYGADVIVPTLAGIAVVRTS